MIKILMFAGFISFCVLMLACWLFIGNFGDFADLLSKKSKKIIEDDTSRFIGTWESGTGELTFYKNGNYTSTMIFYAAGTYSIKNEKLILQMDAGEPNGDSAYSREEAIYNYSFSDNDIALTLTDEDHEASEFFIKQ